MKAQVKKIDGGVAKEIELPVMFSEEYRPDLIKKAVLALQSTRRQPHGSYPYAGICSSAVGWGSGRGASHVPRLKNGSRAAKVPQAKGGREAHPPMTAKVLVKEINAKEKQKAFRSAVAASIVPELLNSRGHIFEGAVPCIFEDKFETLARTQDVISALTSAGCLCRHREGKGQQEGPRRPGQAPRSAGTGRERAYSLSPPVPSSAPHATLPVWMSSPSTSSMSNTSPRACRQDA